MLSAVLGPHVVQFARKAACLLTSFALGYLPAHAKAVVVPQLERQGATIVKDDNHSQFHFFVNAGEPMLDVAQLSDLSDAQLSWQPVSGQACLTRATKALCFDWTSSKIHLNNRPSKRRYKLQLNNDRLYVPLRFVTSTDFAEFAGTTFEWKAKERQLIQNPELMLVIPPVQKDEQCYRLALFIPPSVPYRLVERSDRRIWVRFLRLNSAGSEVYEGDETIKMIEVVQRRRSVDLILTLGKDAHSSDIYFENGRRQLVIDVFRKSVPIIKAPPPVSISRKPTAPTPVLTVPQTPSRASKNDWKNADRAIRTIVIDAGHGGIDSGAIGVRGTLEKDINLRVAKALEEHFKKEKGVRVLMTRSDDTFIPLAKRTEIANHAKADLFISVHCNSSLSAKSAGFEVYVLSPEASDKAAEAVARIENSVVALEKKAGKHSSRLNELLASMAVYNFINESSKCAAYICRQIKSKPAVEKTEVREADFHVLRGAQMPGVLIELEYLSNPVAELKLKSGRFRSQLVKGISSGILDYERHLRQQKQVMALRDSRNESAPQ